MTATMANYWHPIATGRDVTDHPQRGTLLGTNLGTIPNVHAYMP